ncbi:MAG TPA: hypothetical protein VF134_04410 [Candidatus Dormibacteraeota bacterium]
MTVPTPVKQALGVHGPITAGGTQNGNGSLGWCGASVNNATPLAPHDYSGSASGGLAAMLGAHRSRRRLW